MEIVEKAPVVVVGLPVRASWRELWVEMPKVWREFIVKYAEIEDRLGETFVDVSHDKVGAEYLQLVSTQVAKVRRIPDGMQAVEIPAQRYIHHKHVGPIENIAESFGNMYDWAREYGHSVGELKLDFGYTADGDELEHDSYIGLHPMAQWRYVEAV